MKSLKDLGPVLLRRRWLSHVGNRSWLLTCCLEHFVLGVNEAAALSIRTVSLFPESLANLSLVPRMALDVAEFGSVVGELALDAVLADPSLLKGSTHLSLVQGYSLVSVTSLRLAELARGCLLWVTS